MQIQSEACGLLVELPVLGGGPTAGRDRLDNRSQLWLSAHSLLGSYSPFAPDRFESLPSDGQQAQALWPGRRDCPPPCPCHGARGDSASHLRIAVLRRTAAAPVHDAPISDCLRPGSRTGDHTPSYSLSWRPRTAKAVRYSKKAPTVLLRKDSATSPAR